jgi:hypothetical protein
MYVQGYLQGSENGRVVTIEFRDVHPHPPAQPHHIKSAWL